jgi:hypothetical protein
MTWGKWLAILGVATLSAGCVVFFSTTWSSGFAPFERCVEHNTQGLGPNDPLGTSQTEHKTKRLPPEVRCAERHCGPGSVEGEVCRGRAVAYSVRPNAGDWLILAGISFAPGLLISIIAVAFWWLAQRLGFSWPPKRNPFVWIDRDEP